jgi:hypothetical protein
MFVLVIERDNTEPVVFGPFPDEPQTLDFREHLLREWGEDELRHVTELTAREVRSPS